MQSNHYSFKKQDGLITIIVIIILLLSSFICGCLQTPENSIAISSNTPENGIVFNDSYGNRIEIPNNASKIVACQPAVAEMLVTIGAADKIVGVDRRTFLDANIMNKLSQDVKNIDGEPLNVETIIMINPDVIVSWGFFQVGNMDKIKAQNITIVYADCYRLKGLNNDAYVLGELTGNKERAQQYIRFNQKYQELVESRLVNLSSDEIPRVYSESVDYYVMAKESYIGQVIEALHARNIYNERYADTVVKVNAAKINPEWIIQEDPDIITKMDMGESFLSTCKKIMNRTGFNALKAVQSNRIYIYNSDMIGGSNCRSVIGLIYFAKALYPNRFADINPDSVRREYAQEFGFGGDENIEWFYPPFEPVNATSTGANGTVGITKGG